MYPYYLKIRTYTSADPVALFQACLKIADRNGFRLKRRDDAGLALTFTTALPHWLCFLLSKQITIRIRRLGAAVELNIRSRSRTILLIDPPRDNKLAVEKLLIQMEREVFANTPGPTLYADYEMESFSGAWRYVAQCIILLLIALLFAWAKHGSFSLHEWSFWSAMINTVAFWVFIFGIVAAIIQEVKKAMAQNKTDEAAEDHVV